MHPDNDVVATEVKRQTVILVFTLTATAGVIWLEMMREDSIARKRAQLWGALAIKRTADMMAAPWTILSAKAATWYNQLREV